MSTFHPGQLVRNINPASAHYGKIGVFVRELPYVFVSPGCDVQYADATGPYGYPDVAQSVADLERVESEDVK